MHRSQRPLEYRWGQAQAFRNPVLGRRAPRADFARCGALLIDYILVIGALAVSTIFARILGGGARTAGLTAETVGYILAAATAFLNLGLLPIWRGQSLGKWATGLRVERRNDGRQPGLGRLLLRHFVGYPLSLILLGSGYLIAIFNARGLALHDVIARTIVVRNYRRPKRPQRGRS
ncbi:MAG: RDD family protein [Pyrinomonadaceae bacterium]